MDGRLSGPQNRSGHDGEEKKPCLKAGRPAHILVTILTELSRILKSQMEDQKRDIGQGSFTQSNAPIATSLPVSLIFYSLFSFKYK
jgi:hypothetical protein